jgi:hypothetical protein
MKIDMSPEKVTTRIRRVSQLRRLCLSLGKAKPVEKIRIQSAKEKPKAG